MFHRLMLLLVVCAAPILSACVPVAVGVGAAVVADEVAEDQNGGDGLF